MSLSRYFKCEKQNYSEFVKKHAILLTFILCVFFSTFSFMRQESFDPGNLFIATSVFCVLSTFVAFYIHKRFSLNNVLSTIICIVLCIASWGWLVGLHKTETRAVYLFITCFALILVYYTYLVLTKKATVENTLLVLFLIGFLLRLTYVLSTSIYERQHDFYGFYGEQVLSDNNCDGHGGYISYFFYSNFKLPNFDPTLRDQFYHPPLHYFICALWWKAQSLLGIADGYAQENIQTLTLFYSSVCMIVTLKTLDMFKVSGLGKVIAFSVMAFHPTFIIFSGSINNDILSITFMLSAFYFALKWYNSDKLKDILICGLLIGLGMMTKLSAYMICIPIAVVFLVRFFKDIKVNQEESVKKYSINFGLFLIVCAPIALFWSARNLINYQVPIAYVQRLPDDSWQYVGNYSFIERIFMIQPKEYAGYYSVFDQWVSKGDKLYNEFNPMVSLLKTSLFGEYLNSHSYPAIKGFADVLFWSNLLVVILSVVALIYMLVNAVKYKENLMFKVALAVLYFSTLIFYYIFCFTHPHHCTMNIRYVSPLIFAGAIVLGIAIDDLKRINNIKVKKALELTSGITVAIFAMFSTLTYLLIAGSV